MTTGPIQLVVLGFGELDRLQGQMAELQEVRGRDVIRLLDLDPGADRPALDNTVPEGTEAGLTSEEVRQVAATLEPGTAAALLLVEHRWAARLAAAVRDAGGRLVAQGFLTPDARVLLGNALAGVAEAEAAVELADAVRGAALVDALVAAAEEELVEEAAAQAVADAAAEDAALRSAAAADVVRALVAAGVLEDTAALDAVDALVAAGLIDPGVVRLALEADPAAPGGF